MFDGILTKHTCFPFYAMHGKDTAVKAVLCPLIDPSIKGVLIKGSSGVGKTTLVRSLMSEAGVNIVNVPANVTDDQMFGCMDVEYMLLHGGVRVQEGLLGRADGGLMHIDDINLLDSKMMRAAMSSVKTGFVDLERDGISGNYRCRTAVIGTANTTESYMDRRLSDMFDICVTMMGTYDRGVRISSDLDNLNYAADQDGFYQTYAGNGEVLKAKIEKAREALEDVVLDDDMLQLIAESCYELGSNGFTGEMSTVRVSKVLAALDDRTTVTVDDVKEALIMCMSHRRSRVRRKKPKEDHVQFYSGTHMNRFIHDDRKSSKDDSGNASGSPDIEVSDCVSNVSAENSIVDEVVAEIGEAFQSIDLLDEVSKHAGQDGIKRKFVRDKGRDGRYVRATPAEGPHPDVAFDATIRAAAPYQKIRGGNRLMVEPQDIQEKVREKRITSTYIFMIDNSGSLIIRSRMRSVKATVLAILDEHYSKRDRVGIMTFNEKNVGMLMPPTRSVGGIRKVLDDLSAGKMTPLSEALIFARDYMMVYTRKHPAERCHMIIMTDALANIPLVEGSDPNEEALKVAVKARIPGVDWTVVDTGARSKESDNAVKLSQALNATYYKLEDLQDTSN